MNLQVLRRTSRCDLLWASIYWNLS